MTDKPTEKRYVNYVIDASIAVKWFSQEQGRNKALRLLEKAQDGTAVLYAPDLLLYEVGNALWKGKQMSDYEINEALALLLRLGIEFIRLDSSMIGRTTKVMTAHDLTFYDAVYVALTVAVSGILATANPKDHAKINDITILKI